MIRTLKRGSAYHIDCQVGENRLRGALGTKDKGVAGRLRIRIEMAMVEGSKSENWAELRKTLPASTFSRFAGAYSVPKEAYASWAGLVSIFRTECEGRIKLGKMARSTAQRYEYALERFTEFLNLGGKTPLSEITPWMVEDFKVWRRGQILAKANARGGNGLAVDVSALHSVFSVAVERHMVSKNPVRTDGSTTARDVQPFTGEELARLRAACETEEEKLVYAVFRHTGMRVSDVADLQWQHVQKMDREINKVTIKRGKAVQIPIARELFDCLGPQQTDGYVLSRENKPLSIAQIRGLVCLTLERAGIQNGHMHRFRHSLACDLLLKGASPFEVAKILGDTTATVEKHYLKFVSPLRAKIKGMMDDSSTGLEAT